MEAYREVETVKKHCKHKDCVYRGLISSTIETCDYIIFENHRRGCKISECDKYVKGERVMLNYTGAVAVLKEGDKDKWNTGK